MSSGPGPLIRQVAGQAGLQRGGQGTVQVHCPGPAEQLEQASDAVSQNFVRYFEHLLDVPGDLVLDGRPQGLPLPAIGRETGTVEKLFGSQRNEQVVRILEIFFYLADSALQVVRLADPFQVVCRSLNQALNAVFDLLGEFHFP
jgi:hypothetical protein